MTADLPAAASAEASVLESDEWLDLAPLVVATMPDHDADIWLGQLAVELQAASDRAVAWALSRADSMVADARADADRIREQGRRRAQLMARFQAMAHRSILATGDRDPCPRRVDGPTAATLPATPMPLLRWPLLTPPGSTGQPVAGLWPPGGPGPPLRWPAQIPSAPRRDVASPAPAKAAAGVGTAPGAPTRSEGTAHEVAPPPAVPTRRPGPTGSPTSWPAPPVTTPAAPLNPPVTPAQVTTADSSGRPVGGWPRRLRLLVIALVVVAMTNGFGQFESYGTKAQEQGAQHRLRQTFARQVAGTEGPTRGSAVGLLSVPRLGMRDTVVTEGATLRTLQQGPAHDDSSQWPGQQGVVVILGHDSTYGAPFGGLASLRVGDIVSVRTATGFFSYRVSHNPQEVYSGQRALFPLPSPADVRASGNPRLAGQALVLATGAGRGSFPLHVVVATLDQASTGPGLLPRPRTISAALRAVPGDRAGWEWAGIWILVILGCVRLASRLAKKWPARAVYPAAALVALLATSQLYVALDRLFPGTY